MYVFAEVKAVRDDAAPHGSFEVILSAPTLDRDGEVIDAKAFDPLPDHITFDVDHGMSTSTTIASGRPYYDADVLKVRARSPRSLVLRRSGRWCRKATSGRPPSRSCPPIGNARTAPITSPRPSCSMVRSCRSRATARRACSRRSRTPSASPRTRRSAAWACTTSRSPTAWTASSTAEPAAWTGARRRASNARRTSRVATRGPTTQGGTGAFSLFPATPLRSTPSTNLSTHSRKRIRD
jgi:hypothetical protein